MSSFSKEGFEIHPAVFTADGIAGFRVEACRIQKKSGTTCVRDIISSSNIFRQLSSSAKLLALIPKGMAPVRSILFDKTEGNNWPVLWHQDLTIALKEKIEIAGYEPWSEKYGIPHVQPPVELLQNMVTLRIHLDDTQEENGALRVSPRSHLAGKIPSHAIQKHIENTVTTCECKTGDVLLMSPLLLHSSPRTKTSGHRRILHFEYAMRSSLDPRLSWAADND